MRLYAYHDAAGNIESFIIDSAAEGGRIMLAPEPGLFVTEIQGLDEKLLGDEDALGEMAKHHIVEKAQGVSRLIARP